MEGFSRRVRITAGNVAQLRLVRELVWPPRPLVLLCFLSHKAARLFGPVALGAMLIASATLVAEPLGGIGDDHPDCAMSSLGCGRHQAAAYGFGRGEPARRDPELGQHGGDVVVDRLDREAELLGDGGVGLVLLAAHQEDLAAAVGECVDGFTDGLGGLSRADARVGAMAPGRGPPSAAVLASAGSADHSRRLSSAAGAIRMAG